MSAIHDTKLYIFGGLHDDKYASNELFYFELDPSGYFKNRAQNDEKHRAMILQSMMMEGEQKTANNQAPKPDISKNQSLMTLIKKGIHY